MANTSAVADTGPLIALAKIDQLGLLPLLFGTVLIPSVVEQELFAKRSIESRRLEAVLGKHLQIVETPEPAPEVQAATWNLDRGEAGAVALAYSLRLLLIVDDALARKAAERLHVQFVGSVGILLDAKRQKHIPSVLPLLLEMRRQGYWLADDLIELAAVLAGEIKPPGLI